MSLELGGKSPNIVFADADLEAALKGVFMGIFFCQGEICSAGSRLFVEESIYEASSRNSRRWRRRSNSATGSTQRRRWVRWFRASSSSACSNTSASAARKTRAPWPADKSPAASSPAGIFVEPTVFSGVTNAMRIAREEIFGPVVCAIPFKDLPDAIAKGNDSPFGLAAGVWTRDIRKAHQAAAALEAGTVWVNCYNAFDNASPWGGFKQSGWGREKGPYGLDLFTQIKSVIINFG